MENPQINSLNGSDFASTIFLTMILYTQKELWSQQFVHVFQSSPPAEFDISSPS